MRLFSFSSKNEKAALAYHPQTPEIELIEGCKQQNRLAQKVLFEKYHRKMLAAVLRYVSHQMEAEDILAQAFIKVFEHLPNYRNEGSFEGWIRRIVTNEALGFLRKKKHLYFEEIEQADWNGHTTPPDDRLEVEELMALIESLPEGYRTVFNLYVVEGYSHQEIAEQLGISENTSKSQLSRARALLQKWLKKNENLNRAVG
ncbi:RNA polymerase sigma factor [Hugenholtzia roseola]|uniref:RNA polymerase sigma factor n=1 Tax=Hugenholtzia roseola TaxID=1002 RepID=UPI00040B040B|nr:RNA polymerase sigma factor [Hugenholtzia roseola]